MGSPTRRHRAMSLSGCKHTEAVGESPGSGKAVHYESPVYRNPFFSQAVPRVVTIAINCISIRR
jgi:hypothetical protein